MHALFQFVLNNCLNSFKGKVQAVEMGLLIHTMNALSKETINHKKSLMQTMTPFSLCFDEQDTLLSCGAIMLKVENAAKFCFPWTIFIIWRKPYSVKFTL